MLFAIGFFGTTILAVAISGTITSWTTGQVLKSSDLNTTITSLKTAMKEFQIGQKRLTAMMRIILRGMWDWDCRVRHLC